jgi:hypothetical protein
VLGIGEGLALAQDATTAACAGGNALYFAFYFRRSLPPARRLGAATLAVLNFGIFFERVYFIELYVDGAGLEPISWLCAHLLLSLGTFAITALAARQWLNR